MTIADEVREVAAANKLAPKLRALVDDVEVFRELLQEADEERDLLEAHKVNGGDCLWALERGIESFIDEVTGSGGPLDVLEEAEMEADFESDGDNDC